MKPEDLARWQNVIWGVIIMLGAITATITPFVDNDATTGLSEAQMAANITLFFTGLSKLGSATSAEVKEAKQEATDAKIEARVATRTAEESQGYTMANRTPMHKPGEPGEPPIV